MKLEEPERELEMQLAVEPGLEERELLEELGVSWRG